MYAKEIGVTIQTYHVDNGIFKAHKWIIACQGKGQSLTFIGVNENHINIVSERTIRTLEELSRTMLIHRNKIWPKLVTTNLWPYALIMENYVLIENLLMKKKKKNYILNNYSQMQEYRRNQNIGNHLAAWSMHWIRVSKLDT